jgi:hypothetical protein
MGSKMNNMGREVEDEGKRDSLIQAIWGIDSNNQRKENIMNINILEIEMPRPDVGMSPMLDSAVFMAAEVEREIYEARLISNEEEARMDAMVEEHDYACSHPFEFIWSRDNKTGVYSYAPKSEGFSDDGESMMTFYSIVHAQKYYAKGGQV